jgi:alpha-ribazole phosphatase
MSIFLMRHGETRLTGCYCGSLNPPLTSRGRAQAGAAARQLAKYPIDVCYSSPQLRAKQTATLIHHRLHVPVVSNSSLRELHFGAWEGLWFQDIEKKWPRLAKQWADDPMAVRIPRAETFVSLRQRIKRFLSGIKKQFSERHVLIVAHGGSLSAIVLELLGLPDKEFPKHIQPTGSIRRIQGKTLSWVGQPC